eukprot:GFUD01029361.1.p1 GENE.GFUD01029361.1~~GFUD01029361.1.p1  ORF type:complete len:400 (+),score=108.44 GFUD01029361.1:198-1397(+)
MPATRQGASSSSSKRPARRSASVKINYSDQSPTKVAKVEPMDIRRNLGDAWSGMVKGCKVDLGKNKKPSSSAPFVIGNRKTTTVKMLNPEIITLDEDKNLRSKTTSKPSILPKSLTITKIGDTTARNTKQPAIKDKWSVAIPKQGIAIQKQTSQSAPKPLAAQNSVFIKKVASLPGISIQQTVKKIEETKVVGSNEKDDIDTENSTVDTPKRVDKENLEQRNISRLRNVTTPNQKNHLDSSTLTRSSGRILKKPSIINSQKKAIVRTIKKLNQDQKNRIEERLGDIGSNLQKVKPKEAEEIAPPIEKKPLNLNEVLSDASWLNMFLQTEPTARYNAAEETLYCHTCKNMLEDESNDGWVEGHTMGVNWLKYREHKLGEEHQKTSTKYFLQLFTAHMNYV